MAIIDWIYPKKCLGCRRRGEYFCLDCQKKMERRGVSLEYAGIVRRAIKEIKYRGTYDLVAALVKIWQPSRPQGEVVVTSVPMWRGKKRRRGYNQAELMAREVAKQWGVEYLELLLRMRETRPMYGLTREERAANIKGAFRINPQAEISSKTLVVVDDVWTSGATLGECCRVLRRAGWVRVIPMALAS